MNATALIAEDEPLLAEALARQLQRLWPELRLLPAAGDGATAIERALQERPDVLFFDIQMPDVNGLDAAETLLDNWPDAQRLPLTVFVTAHDQYALAAFDQAAVDYVLKPVQAARLAATIERLQRQLAWRGQGGDDTAPEPLAAATLPRHPEPPDMALLRGDCAQRPDPLTVVQVAVGPNLLLVPVEEVLCFEAADKYVRLLTARPGQAELLIRTPLRELLPRLDPHRFWQVHRGAIVNVTAIDQVQRHNGRLRIHIRGCADTLEVSRLYAHRFKAM